MFSSSLILLSPAIKLLTVEISVEDVISERNVIRMQNPNSTLFVGFAELLPTPSWANAQFRPERPPSTSYDATHKQTTESLSWGH